MKSALEVAGFLTLVFVTGLHPDTPQRTVLSLMAAGAVLIIAGLLLEVVDKCER